jgi:hypothetical protein
MAILSFEGTHREPITRWLSICADLFEAGGQSKVAQLRWKGHRSSEIREPPPLFWAPIKANLRST